MMEDYRKALLKGYCQSAGRKHMYYDRVLYGYIGKPSKRFETRWNLRTLRLEGLI